MKHRRRSDYVAANGMTMLKKEYDIVALDGCLVFVHRDQLGIGSGIQVFTLKGTELVRGYRTGMGVFTLFDYRSKFKFHHSFGLWGSVWKYLQDVILVRTESIGIHE
jgi:hypothetical protein